MRSKKRPRSTGPVASGTIDDSSGNSSDDAALHELTTRSPTTLPPVDAAEGPSSGLDTCCVRTGGLAGYDFSADVQLADTNTMVVRCALCASL